MAFRVKIAESPEELDALFRCRHRVFVDQERCMDPRPDGRLHDAFDAWPVPHCVNFVAVADDEVIGGVRLLLPEGGRATSAEHLFDFSAHLTPGVPRASGSLLCLDGGSSVRDARLAATLMSVFYHYAICQGFQELYACIAEHIWPYVGPRVGMRALTEGGVAHGDMRFVPATLWMPGLRERDPWATFMQRHDLHEFLGIWERAFFEPGDVVFRRGDPADEAYIVIDGELEARLGDDVEPLVVGRPYLFGEEEMLTGRYRETDVVARTRVDLIVVDRATFFSKIAQQPSGAIRFARLLQQVEDRAPERRLAVARADEDLLGPVAEVLRAANVPERHAALADQPRAVGQD